MYKRQELGNKAKTYMDQGLLVPDELVVDLVVDRVQQDDCKNGYVLEMCIRDRGRAYRIEKRMSHITIVPVSYTHLDVYKRQVSNSAST